MFTWPTLRLSEEVVRFAFEVQLEQATVPLCILFSNPTAGPWKTIKYQHDDGTVEELYRFGREEGRPDLIVYDRTDGQCLVIEAKARARDLATAVQVRKAQSAFDSTAVILNGLKERLPAGVSSIVPGFLWGSDPAQFNSDAGLMTRCMHATGWKPDRALCIGACNLDVDAKIRASGDEQWLEKLAPIIG